MRYVGRAIESLMAWERSTEEFYAGLCNVAEHVAYVSVHQHGLNAEKILIEYLCLLEDKRCKKLSEDIA